MNFSEIFESIIGSECVPIASIAVICFVVGLFWKTWERVDDKWIPVVCAVLGGILGVVGLMVIPGYPANNWMDAFMHGAFSGLVATGAHQIYKQLTKPTTIIIGSEDK